MSSTRSNEEVKGGRKVEREGEREWKNKLWMERSTSLLTESSLDLFVTWVWSIWVCLVSPVILIVCLIQITWTVTHCPLLLPLILIRRRATDTVTSLVKWVTDVVYSLRISLDRWITGSVQVRDSLKRVTNSFLSFSLLHSLSSGRQVVSKPDKEHEKAIIWSNDSGENKEILQDLVTSSCHQFLSSALHTILYLMKRNITFIAWLDQISSLQSFFLSWSRRSPLLSLSLSLLTQHVSYFDLLLIFTPERTQMPSMVGWNKLYK